MSGGQAKRYAVKDKERPRDVDEREKMDELELLEGGAGRQEKLEMAGRACGEVTIETRCSALPGKARVMGAGR